MSFPFDAVGIAVLGYLSVLLLGQALSGYIGLHNIVAYTREASKTALTDLLHRKYFAPVSILVPAFNRERTIVAALRSMLKLEHPDFEIIVANDGSTDGTLDVLMGAFGLAEVPVGHDQAIRTAPVHRMFRSSRYPNLTVMDKSGGGRADAINAALNVARHPL
ncbi:MAG: glycosyltransferase, partial [Candidatus Binatia bacterium]